MLNQKRNEREFTYKLYLGKTPIIDEEGFDTGETEQSYSKEYTMRANISPAVGQVQIESFGNLQDYDHVIITHDKDCPIDEHSIIYYDNRRYIVRRIAKSLNCISIAIAQSDVSVSG